MKKVFLGLVAMLVLAIVSPVFAQEESPVKTKFMVWEVKVSPFQMGGLMDALKFEKELFESNDFPYSTLVQHTNDGLLWYAMPFDNYADIDKIFAAFDSFWKDNPEEQKKFQEMINGNWNSLGRKILELEPELSHTPDDSEPTTSTRFRLYERFQVVPGKGEEFKKHLKTYISLLKEHDIKHNFYVLSPTFDSDMSQYYFVSEEGMNASEHYSLSDEKWKTFGEAGQKLWEEVSQTIAGMVFHLGAINYDLSYTPKE